MSKRSFSLSPAERWATFGCVGAGLLAAFVLTEPLGFEPPGGAALLTSRPLEPGGDDGFMAKPPFDPERHPLNGVGSLPSDAPVVVDPGPPPEPPLRLAGILADETSRKALFVGIDGWQAPGAVVGGWTIEAIEPRRVSLAKGGERKVLDASDALRP